MPRTGLSPAELKERAIDVAEERLRRDGFDRIRLADIARDLSVTHVALYKHFPDKAALIDAVTTRWLHVLHETMEGVAQGPEPVGERIRTWFLTYHRLKREKVLRDPEPYRAFGSAFEEMKPSIVCHMGIIHRQLEGLVREAMEAGLLRQGDPMETALLMLETTTGFHHPKIVAERLDEDREPALKVALETTLKGLC
jgi:AcrR family transcriptional regulator